MKTYSYTQTRTRTEAVVDQFEIFLRYAGIPEERRIKILHAVQQQYLEKVGVYLVDSNGSRILEIALVVDWTAHAGYVAINPHLSVDLPGWEDRGAPEIHTLGRRFGQKAQEYGQRPGHWVQFALAIRNNVAYHQRLCSELGYAFRGAIPAWRTPPANRSIPLLDLDEVTIAVSES